MATKTNTERWAVVYVGAPYGENESGEIVSRHRSEEAAIAARQKLQGSPRYYGSSTKVLRVGADGNAIRE